MHSTYAPGIHRGHNGAARAAIIRVLLDNAGPGGRVAFRQWEVARDAGAARETVNRVLRDLEADGLVRRMHGRTEIVDVEALAQVIA